MRGLRNKKFARFILCPFLVSFLVMSGVFCGTCEACYEDMHTGEKHSVQEVLPKSYPVRGLAVGPCSLYFVAASVAVFIVERGGCETLWGPRGAMLTIERGGRRRVCSYQGTEGIAASENRLFVASESAVNVCRHDLSTLQCHAVLSFGYVIKGSLLVQNNKLYARARSVQASEDSFADSVVAFSAIDTPSLQLEFVIKKACVLGVLALTVNREEVYFAAVTGIATCCIHVHDARDGVELRQFHIPVWPQDIAVMSTGKIVMNAVYTDGRTWLFFTPPDAWNYAHMEEVDAAVVSICADGEELVALTENHTILRFPSLSPCEKSGCGGGKHYC